MPSFEVLITGAPTAFSKGCRSLNSTFSSDSDKFNLLLSQALQYSSNSQNSCNLSFETESIEFSVLLYILKSKLQSTPVVTHSNLVSVLDSFTFLSREVIAGIHSALENYTPTEISSEAKISNHLSNFQWKIGVSISSSGCKALSAPFVAISFDVQDINGKITAHTAELSYSEFQEFHRSFTHASSIMDSL